MRASLSVPDVGAIFGLVWEIGIWALGYELISYEYHIASME